MAGAQGPTAAGAYVECLAFLRQVDRSVAAGLDLRFIANTDCTHKHRKVAAWLATHPRVHADYIPTSSSWLNLAERSFGKTTDQCTGRRVFRSVHERT